MLECDSDVIGVYQGCTYSYDMHVLGEYQGCIYSYDRTRGVRVKGYLSLARCKPAACSPRYIIIRTPSR